MKKIFAIAWKDTLMRFTGWSEWLFFLILPIVFTLVLAGGTGGRNGRTGSGANRCDQPVGPGLHGTRHGLRERRHGRSMGPPGPAPEGPALALADYTLRRL